ncbi:MAG: hypothetical protein ACLQGN_26755 [Mycobacterium sp.]|uniref:hypothetical protein n=1 Tax=Mycobacterium sp. TaxID=1785 RepID=UPI003F969C1D
MDWTKLSSIAAAALAAVLIAVPATTVAAPAYAVPGVGGVSMASTDDPASDCGDSGNPPCTGPVATPDEVVAVMAKLTDPSVPAANKTDIVTPGFTPEEAQTIDDHLNRMNARGLLPLNFVVTDIQPALANLAGATLATTGTFHQRSAPKPIVLVDQGGHWLITHDTAMTAMDAFWYNAHRHMPVVVPAL